MTVRDIATILKANIVVQGNLDLEIKSACGSDMMSDVLAFVKDQSVLLTGLINSQVLRTAEMMDMLCVVLVRGKEPTEDMCALAEKSGITLLTTGYRLFTACGLLFEHGLQGECDEP